MSYNNLIQRIDGKLEDIAREYLMVSELAPYQVGDVDRRLDRLHEKYERYKRTRARLSRDRARQRWSFYRKVYSLPEDVQRHIRGYAGR